MAFTKTTIVHVVLILFSLVELVLNSYVASLYQQPFGVSRSPDIINFLIFASVWSLLVLAYIGLTPMYLAGFFHRLAVLGLLVVTSIFWFAGSVALASFMGGPWNCGRNTWCGSIEAIIAFGFVTWALFTGLTIFEVLEYRKQPKSDDPHKPMTTTQPYVSHA